MSDLCPFLLLWIISPFGVRIVVNTAGLLKEEMISFDHITDCGFGDCWKVILLAVFIKERFDLLFA